MSDPYSFNDPDFKYTDPKTGLLRNIPNITDAKQLHDFEHTISSKQIFLLKTSPIKVNTSKDVLETHKFIFKDIYPFAGQMRTCPIWKRGQQFAMPNEIPERLKQIDKLIAQYNTIPTDQPILDLRNQVSDKLAGIINAINWMHGFREGNGRTQRAVGHSLALDKNFDLQLNRDKDSETYKRYMAGTSENDNEILSNIIFENLKPFSDL